MSDDSDAERILREREVERARARARIVDARRDVEAELRRLRHRESPKEPSDAEDLDARPHELLVLPVPSPGRSEGRPPTVPALDDSGEPREPFREIGGSIRPETVREWLALDPGERFDLERLNSLGLRDLTESAAGDPELLGAIAERAEALMTRVKQEVDDPVNAGAFLRERVVAWFRESPTAPDWTARTRTRWAGLFAESRVSGGKLYPWLNHRLWTLRERALKEGPIRLRLKRGFGRSRAMDAAIGRSPGQQIIAEVAQAMLDDLATHTRDGEAPLPLVHLSEIAVRRQVPTVSDALALLFHGPESGPFVVLHPNRYPDCPELVIRPPAAGARGAALAYSLAPAHPVRKTGGAGRKSPETSAERTAASGFAGGDEDDPSVDLETVWEAESVAPGTWRRLVEERKRERRHLDPPPRDCRSKPAYAGLRELILIDDTFRKAFVAVKWRGRPAGLPILATLLQKGQIAPEIATDHEYLEAELGELAQGDPQWHPPDGSWAIQGWKVSRTGSHQDGFRFVAERAG